MRDTLLQYVFKLSVETPAIIPAIFPLGLLKPE